MLADSAHPHSASAPLPPYVVTPDDTALAVGSGDVRVLGTPRLIAWLEAATMAACAGGLTEDQTSVGTRVDVEHLLASPVGASVSVTADVVHRDGRLLRCEVAAHHDVGQGPVLIGHGHITRVVVQRDRFVARSAPSRIIRRAVPGEWDAIGELCVTAYSQGTGFPLGTDGYAAVLRDVAGRASCGEVLVALQDGQLVGTITSIPGGQELAEIARLNEVEFRFMAVHPTAWRRGVGRALIDAVLESAESAALVCSVIDGNDAAAGLYRSLGFVRDESRDRMLEAGVGLRAFVRAADVAGD